MGLFFHPTKFSCHLTFLPPIFPHCPKNSSETLTQGLKKWGQHAGCIPLTLHVSHRLVKASHSHGAGHSPARGFTRTLCQLYFLMSPAALGTGKHMRHRQTGR